MYVGAVGRSPKTMDENDQGRFVSTGGALLGGQILSYELIPASIPHWEKQSCRLLFEARLAYGSAHDVA